QFQISTIPRATAERNWFCKTRRSRRVPGSLMACCRSSYYAGSQPTRSRPDERIMYAWQQVLLSISRLAIGENSDSRYFRFNHEWKCLLLLFSIRDAALIARTTHDTE